MVSFVRHMSMTRSLHSPRKLLPARAVVLCLAASLAAACSSGSHGTTTSGPQPSPPDSPAPSHSSPRAPSLKTQVQLTASDGGGDKITGYVAFGPALPVTDTSLLQSTFDSCTGHGVMDPARTEVSQMRIVLTGASSMADKVTVTFNGASLGYIFDMPDGLQCAGEEGPSYQTTLTSGRSSSMLIWLIHPRANSRSPSVTYVALGSHELECPRLVAADPFCGFLDGFDVFHAE